MRTLRSCQIDPLRQKGRKTTVRKAERDIVESKGFFKKEKQGEKENLEREEL